MFTVFEIAPEMNGWAAPIMRSGRDSGSSAPALRLEGAVEDRKIIVAQVRSAFDRVLLPRRTR